MLLCCLMRFTKSLNSFNAAHDSGSRWNECNTRFAKIDELSHICYDYEVRSREVNGRDEIAESKEKCGTALDIREQFLFLKSLS